LDAGLLLFPLILARFIFIAFASSLLGAEITLTSPFDHHLIQRHSSTGAKFDSQKIPGQAFSCSASIAACLPRVWKAL